MEHIYTYMVTKYVDILMIWWYAMGVYHVHVQYMVWYPQSKRKHCKSKMTLLWKDHMSIFKVMVKVLLLATRQEKETASTAKMVWNGEFQSFFGCKYLETSFQLKHACFLSLVEFWDQQGSIWMFLWLGQVILQLHYFCSVTHHQYKAHEALRVADWLRKVRHDGSQGYLTTVHGKKKRHKK